MVECAHSGTRFWGWGRSCGTTEMASQLSSRRGYNWLMTPPPHWGLGPPSVLGTAGMHRHAVPARQAALPRLCRKVPEKLPTQPPFLPSLLYRVRPASWCETLPASSNSSPSFHSPANTINLLHI